MTWRWKTGKEKKRLTKKIIKFKKQGLTFEQISQRLEISKGYVWLLYKKALEAKK